MPEIREVTVEFRKTVSDGSYGNETYSVRFTATPDADEPWTGVAFRLAHKAHDTVLSRLRGSTNEQIQYALMTPEEREARRERERAEREAEREPWRLQAEEDAAERQAAEDEGDDHDQLNHAEPRQGR
jgi:uncharacterized Zn finger protein